MGACVKVGSAKLRHPETAGFKGRPQLDHTVHLAGALAILRAHDDRCAMACGKSEKGLYKTAVNKNVRCEVAEITEAVDKDSFRPNFSDRFRYLLVYGLPLHFGRRKNIVGLDLRKNLRRRRKIQDRHRIQLQMNSSSVRADPVRRLRKRDEKSVIAGRKEVQA